MGLDYAKPLARDRSGNGLQEYPAACSAIGVTVTENAAASSVMNLTANTTTIEVAAVNNAAFIRWTTKTFTNASGSVISAAGTANFDHVIPKDTYRRFVVPRLTQAIPNWSESSTGGAPSIVGLNTAEGLFNAVATKSAGNGSVLLTEY